MDKKELLVRLCALLTSLFLVVFTALFALGAKNREGDGSILTDGGSSVKEKEENFLLILDVK